MVGRGRPKKVKQVVIDPEEHSENEEMTDTSVTTTNTPSNTTTTSTTNGIDNATSTTSATSSNNSEVVKSENVGEKDDKKKERPSRKSKETAKRIIHQAINPKDKSSNTTSTTSSDHDDDDDHNDDEEKANDDEPQHAPRVSYATQKRKAKLERLSKKRGKKVETSDEEAEEEEPSESESDSSDQDKKKKKKKKKASKKKKSTKKKTKDEDVHTSDSEQEKKKKKRKTTSSTSKSKKPKKVKPGMRELNDDVLKAIKKCDNDPFVDTSSELNTIVSPVRTSKEGFRALNIKNYELLKKVLKEEKQVNNPFIQRSIDNDWTIVDYAIRANDTTALDLIFEVAVENNRSRASQSHSIQTIETGFASKRTYGRAVRNVNVSRGGREGIDVAFAKDSSDYSTFQSYNFHSIISEAIKRSVTCRDVKVETIDYLIIKRGLSTFGDDVFYAACESGNVPIAYHLAKKLNEQDGFGLNHLHVESLEKDGTTEFTTYKSVSIPKKALANDVTPVHLAALNPNTKYLKELIEASSDGCSIIDRYQRRPIHFAACSSTSDNIKYLLEKGSNIIEKDTQKRTPLHYAAKYGHDQNIEILCPKDSKNGSIKDKFGYSPLHLAAWYNQIQVCKKLLDCGTPVDVSAKLKETPLMSACKRGHLELMKVLIERGAKIEKLCTRKKSLLMYASMNGHYDIVKFLLEKGMDPNHKDSAGNSVIHYAVAYGWFEIVQLLLTAGGDLHALNSWKYSPLNIAMLKSHYGITEFILNDKLVDLNLKDSEGFTLIHKLMTRLDEQNVNQIKYLITTKKDRIDLSIKGPNDTSLFHYITGHSTKFDIELAKLFIQSNLHYDDIDSSGTTPLMKAFNYSNIKMIKFLLEQGSRVRCEQHEQNILHLVLKQVSSRDLNRLFDVIYENMVTNKKIYTSSNKNAIMIDDDVVEHFDSTTSPIISDSEQLFYKMANTIDGSGKTPLMSMIHAFSPTSHSQQHELAEDSDGESTPFPVSAKTMNEDSVFGSIFDVDKKKKKQPKKKKKKDVLMEDPMDSNEDEHYEIGSDDEESDGVSDEGETSKLDDSIMADKSMMEDDDESIHSQSSISSESEKEEVNESFIDDSEATPKSATLPSSSSTFIPSKLGMEEPLPPVMSTFGSAFGSSSSAFGIIATTGSGSAFGSGSSSAFRSFSKLSSATNHQDLDSDGEPYEIDYYGNKRKKREIPTGESVDRFLEFLDKYLKLTKTSLKDAIIQHIPYKSKIKVKDPHTNKMKVKAYPSNECIGYTPMHYAVAKQSDQLIKAFITKYRLNVNVKDFKGITPLHLAVHATSDNDGGIHAVKYLLKYGAELNAKDSFGRTPFFYSFTKIQYNPLSGSNRYSYGYGSSNSSSSDPIELVSDMCNFEGIETDITDNYGRSPLHYAAIQGSTISSIFLIQRGAELNRKDEDGNTPTNLALLASHVDFVVTLINKGGDVHAPIYSQLPTLIKTIREQLREQLKREKIQNISNQSKHVIGGTSSGGGGESDMDSDDDSDDDNDDESDYDDDDYSSKQTNQETVHYEEEPIEITQQEELSIEEQVSKRELESCTIFKYALSHTYMGLAYLIMQEPNIKPTQVISDALETHQYSLVQKLIRKTRNDLLLNDLNSDGQNVMHLVAKNNDSSKEWKDTWAITITKMLLRRQLNLNLTDKIKGRTPLHYAAKNLNSELVSLLLKHGALPNTLDTKYKRSALHYACKNGSDTTMMMMHTNNHHHHNKNAFGSNLNNTTSHVHSIIESLITSNANIDLQEGKYGRTALHLSVIRRDKIAVKDLITRGANPNIKDRHLNRTPLHYATIETMTEIVKVLLTAPTINVTIPDGDGRIPLHYAVGINLFGYIQNVNLVKELVKSNHSDQIHIKDKDGKSPLYYSLRQSNGIYTKILQLEKEDIDEKLRQASQSEIKSLIEYMSTFTIPHIQVDVEKDANQAILQFEEEESKRPETEEEKKDRIPKMDKYCKLKNCKVLIDESNDTTNTTNDTTSNSNNSNNSNEDDVRYYHTILNKTDVKYGTSGYNNFYILQIGYNQDQNLYVLLNRYGRVGEDGQYQTTPFQSKDECISEFKKIFKSKTGNEWGKEFEEKTKKYKVVDISKRKVKDPLQPIDLSKSVQSALPPPIYNLMKLVCDITLLRKDLIRLGISDEYFSLGQLSKDRLKKGYQILGDVLKLIKEINDRSSTTTALSSSEILVKMNQIADLSNEFYSLIPHKNFVNCAIKSFDRENEVLEKMKSLEDLIELRIAARILIAASFNLSKMNPLDYTYHGLDAQLAPLQSTDEEFSVINRYIANNGGDPSINTVNIFRVNRRSESERYESFLTKQQESNKSCHRMLLWHGSPISNFLSILSKGLLIAPKEAPASGYMFGKGIYCADMFSKSFGYCRAEQDSTNETHALLLLCEVIVGNPYKTYSAEYMEEAKDGFDSTMGVGSTGPNADEPFVQYDGVHIPLGSIVPTPKPPSNDRYWSFPLRYNEYIVYNIDQVKIRYMVHVKSKN